MYTAEHAPLISEDPELGDFIQEEVLDVQRPGRSKSFLRTLAAVFVIGAVAAVVVTGPIDNPLHADMGKVQQDWGFSFSDAFNYAKKQGSSAVDYAKEHGSSVADYAKTHGSAALQYAQNHTSSALDSAQSLGHKLMGWTKQQAEEHQAKLTKLFDSHFSNETQAFGAMSIARFKAAAKNAQQEAQARFCSLRSSSYGMKNRLGEKMRQDFANKTSVCGVDFKSQACRDLCVADACSSAGTGLTADLCKISFNEVVKDMQEKVSAGLVEAQQKSAILAGPGGALETNIKAQMGAVDKQFAAVCN